MIIEADFKSLEVTCAAYLSRDPVMMQEVMDGIDPHAENAKTFFGTTDKRSEAKAGTFSIQFGATPAGVAWATGMSFKKASMFVDFYWEKYNGLKRYNDKNIALCLHGEDIVTPTGRRYSFKVGRDGSYDEVVRKVKNYPTQGFAGRDIVPIAMIKSWQAIKGMKTLMINEIHDSVLLDSPDEEVYTACSKMKDAFEIQTRRAFKKLHGFEFDLPLRCEIKTGPNWGETEVWNGSLGMS